MANTSAPALQAPVIAASTSSTSTTWESQDIKWRNMNKTRFFSAGCVAFLIVRGIAFPASLVKTRLQVGSETGATRDVFLKIARREGLRGFYKGFATASVGMVPAQCLYLTFYESLRDKPLPFAVPASMETQVQTFVAGAFSSMMSQMILNPNDVVSQRLMVQQQSASEGAKYKNARSAFMSLYHAEGIRGLYRGYFATIAVSAPSSALWWTVYMTLKPILLNTFCPLPPHIASSQEKKKTTEELVNARTHSRVLEKALQGFAGLCSGVVAATLTNPLDVLKTRYQVDVNAKQTGLMTTLRVLLQEDGVRGLARGLPARILHTAPASVMSILVYEWLKEFSSK